MSAPITSLLVRDHVVPVKKIEEAIQRQVISGGELATALLELGAAPENVIAAYSAACFGLLPATRDEVMGVTREVVRIVPREVAEQHRLVPVSAEGRQLVVAAARPLASEVHRQLEFLLGVELSVRMASDVRIAAALAHSYAIEMAPRMRRLAERLAQQDAGIVPEIAPFDVNVAQRPDDSVAKKPGGSTYERPTAGDANRANPAPALGPVTGRSLGGSTTTASAAPSRLGPAPSSAPRPASSAAPGAAKNAAPAVARFAPGGGRAAASEPASPSGPPRSELVRKHRGPMSAQVAVELLGKAESRDDILAVSFAFMRQFFDYTVMFVVHDDIAEGLDAFGSGPSWDKVQQVAGSLVEAGVLKQVAEHLVPRVSQLDETTADKRLARHLERASQQPCLLLPVAIRQRVVILFYGDRGGEDFGLSDVPEPLGFVPRVSEALQRLILRRKQKGASANAGPSVAPKAQSGSGASAWPAASNAPARKAPGAASSAPAKSSPAMPAATTPKAAPGQASPGRSAAASASTGSGAAKPADPRSPHLAVLGVPRDAPPPPLVRRTIAVGEPPAPEKRPEPFRGEPPRAFARPVAPSSPKLEAAAPAKPAVAAPVQADGDADDEPEITVDEVDEDFDIDEAAAAPRAGSYSQRGGFTDVVARKPALQPVDPPPNATGRGGRERAPSPAVADRDDGDDGGDPALRSTVPMVDVPKVIVSMGDTVESVVSELAFASREKADEHVRRVLDLGPAALPMLVQAFPGPVWNARTQASSPTTARELSPVALALAAFGDAAAPYLVTLFADEDADIRYYALVTAESIVHRDLVAPLGVRLFDTDDAVATLAMQLLRKHRRFHREHQEVLDKVRSTARSPRVSERRRALALEALGELRDARSLRALVQFLEQGPERLARAAHKSLVALTRQDFGPSAKRWQPWIEEHGRKHRIEWLIDALLHLDEEQRRLAGDELKQLTQEYFGYHHASGRKEREIAQKKYRAWWDADGQKKFAGA